MRVAYAKLGRSVLLDPAKWGEVGGDNEPLALLKTLAVRNPDVEWVIAGRHSGDPGNLPPNVIVPDQPKHPDARKETVTAIYEEVDGAVLWLGQHGTSNQPVPQDKDPSINTNPQEWCLNYAGPIIQGLNANADRFEPVWLCADPRNYLKARDLKQYPVRPILGQFAFERTQRHYRYDDERTPEELGLNELSVMSPPANFWKSRHSYVYSGLELTGVPPWEDESGWPTFDEREHFGIIINEARAYVNPAKQRANIVKTWVNPLEPAFLNGTWSENGLKVIGRGSVQPVHYTELHHHMVRAKSTLTTPSSGSEWATAKPWEAFALRVVCFFHPYYDTQGHIIPTLKQVRDNPHEYDEDEKYLAWWLRPQSPSELQERVEQIDREPATWLWLTDAQHRLLRRAREENLCVRTIENYLGLDVEP